MVYISHNLGLILETCDRIAVMYSGQAVEFGSVKQVFDEMRHPYTRGLFNSIPLPGTDRHARPLMPIRGQLPLPYDRPPGCTFGPRCDHFVSGRCNRPPIPMEPVQDDPGHAVRCVRYREIDWSVKLVDGIHQLPIAFGPPVIEVRNMKKYYEVRDTSFSGVFFKKASRFVKAK